MRMAAILITRALAAPPSLGEALLETGDEEVLRQLLADEDQDRPLLVGLRPRLADVAAHHHVHALEDDPARVALHPQHALVAQEIRAVDLDDAGEKGLELRAVERLGGAEDERLDLVVVLVRVQLGEELRVELEDRVQVEAADVEYLVDRRVAEVHLLDLRARIHFLDPLGQIFNFIFRNQICLRHQDPIGKADLLLRLVELVELLRRVLRVDERDDRIEQVVVADLLVCEEGLRHRAGIRHAGGLDHHAVELERARVALLLQRAEDADQVAAHRAADAAVVHLDDLLLAALDDLAVDADLAELVLDHGDALAVVFLEDPVEERRFPAAEKARKNGDGHHVLFRHGAILSRGGEVRRDVDLIDLLGREEALGVAQVDARAEKEVEQLRVDVPVLLHEAHDLDRLRQRLRFLVGAVAGGEGPERFG